MQVEPREPPLERGAEVYTPNATWSRVRSAVQGANLLIYLGHGNGFPNPYNATLTPLKVDGFGLKAP